MGWLFVEQNSDMVGFFGFEEGVSRRAAKPVAKPSGWTASQSRCLVPGWKEEAVGKKGGRRRTSRRATMTSPSPRIVVDFPPRALTFPYYAAA